jgi:hypothetical protein
MKYVIEDGGRGGGGGGGGREGDNWKLSTLSCLEEMDGDEEGDAARKMIRDKSFCESWTALLCADAISNNVRHKTTISNFTCDPLYELTMLIDSVDRDIGGEKVRSGGGKTEICRLILSAMASASPSLHTMSLTLALKFMVRHLYYRILFFFFAYAEEIPVCHHSLTHILHTSFSIKLLGTWQRDIYLSIYLHL